MELLQEVVEDLDQAFAEEELVAEKLVAEEPVAHQDESAAAVAYAGASCIAEPEAGTFDQPELHSSTPC